MTRMVNCIVLKQQAEGLDAPPHPGDLGIRIYENVSKQGWQQWLERLAAIINETGLNTSDPKAMPVIEQHMTGFLFSEGEGGGPPQGFRAAM